MYGGFTAVKIYGLELLNKLETLYFEGVILCLSIIKALGIFRNRSYTVTLLNSYILTQLQSYNVTFLHSYILTLLLSYSGKLETNKYKLPIRLLEAHNSQATYLVYTAYNVMTTTPIFGKLICCTTVDNSILDIISLYI